MGYGRHPGGCRPSLGRATGSRVLADSDADCLSDLPDPDVDQLPINRCSGAIEAPHPLPHALRKRHLTGTRSSARWPILGGYVRSIRARIVKTIAITPATIRKKTTCGT